MVVAREDRGQLHIIDRLKEMVRLSGGLNADGELDPASQERALECLSRFGQRLRGIAPERVRIVGTSTLRRARNSRKFRSRARELLGNPVEVIGGREEARLIYLGVSRSMAFDDNPRCVVDIGGGSTEVIIGRGFTPVSRESLEMGCVNMTQRFFPKGRITRKAMRRAITAARLEVEPIEKSFRDVGWTAAIGCSGTIRAAASVAHASRFGEDGLDARSVGRLVDAVIDAGHIDELDFKGLSRNRQPVFAGGVAVLAGVFEELGVDRMSISDKALREGLLFDLQGRLSDDDVRESAVTAMCSRYGVDLVHADQVRETALRLYAAVADDWGIRSDRAEDTLRWAALLHEVGFVVSHTKYHRHGEYLIRNTDLEGFSREEQAVLATLVRNHRRAMDVSLYDSLSGSWVDPAFRLTLLLRLAVLLHRGRVGSPPTSVKLSSGRRSIELNFPVGWLDDHPLTRADLIEERARFASAEVNLRVKSQD